MSRVDTKIAPIKRIILMLFFTIISLFSILYYYSVLSHTIQEGDGFTKKGISFPSFSVLISQEHGYNFVHDKQHKYEKRLLSFLDFVLPLKDNLVTVFLS